MSLADSMTRNNFFPPPQAWVDINKTFYGHS